MTSCDVCFLCVQTHVCLCFCVRSNRCLFLNRNTYVLYLWWTYAFNNEFILRIYSPLAYWTLCWLLGVPDCLMGCCVACLESVSVSFGRSCWCSCWFTWLLLSTWQCSPVSTLPFLGIAHRLLGSLLMFLCVCLTLLAQCSSVCLGHSLLLLPLHFACNFHTISCRLLGGLFLIYITVSCHVFVCTSPFPLTLSLYTWSFLCIPACYTSPVCFAVSCLLQRFLGLGARECKRNKLCICQHCWND